MLPQALFNFLTCTAFGASTQAAGGNAVRGLAYSMGAYGLIFVLIISIFAPISKVLTCAILSQAAVQAVSCLVTSRRYAVHGTYAFRKFVLLFGASMLIDAPCHVQAHFNPMVTASMVVSGQQVRK